MALGWGTTYYDGEEVNILRGVPLPVWTNEDCDQAYFQPITEVFLCAGYADGGRDACQGDSGGPLMLYDEEAQSWLLVRIFVIIFDYFSYPIVPHYTVMKCHLIVFHLM